MATTVVRPVHRRQGSDGVTAIGAPITLDGRILEAQEPQPRGRQLKDDEGRGPTKPQAVKPTAARPPPLAARAPPQHDKGPMTPPRVSGVSLAPLPNPDLSCGDRDRAGGGGGAADRAPAPSGQHAQAQHQQQPHGPKLQHRPSFNHRQAQPILPPCAAAAPQGGGASGGCQQLIAEGRGIQRTVPVDPFVAAYLDINGGDADSLSATSPRLDISVVMRGDSGGALGPLTPCPLSPSILTLCKPGVDDEFVFSGTAEPLVDMRMCQSPQLPSL